MAAKKAQATPIARSEQQAAENETFPYAVEAPYRAGWEHALTRKCGRRGKNWTSTKSEPQWTVRFRESEAAVWFRNTWAVVPV
jgi:hypothetical protein